MAHINDNIQQGLAQVFANYFGSGVIRIFDQDGVTVIASFPLPDPAFSISNGILTLLGTPIIVQSVSQGVATSAELVSADQEYKVEELSVSSSASTGHLVLNNTSIVQGQDVVLNSYSFTIPANIKDPG